MRSPRRPPLDRTATILARLAGGALGAALGGVIALVLVFFIGIGRIWVVAPVVVGLAVGLVGGDRGLWVLMRVVGNL